VSRLTRSASYLLVLLLSFELAVWGGFLVGARPFGVAFPVAAVVAGVGNLGLGAAGGRIAQRTVGAVLPELVWLAVALALATMRPEGDTVVPATLRGYAFLAVGAIAGAVAIGLAMGRGATPQGQDGR
jgi:hypothetical protein